MGPRDLKALLGELDTNCNSSPFLEGIMKMADVVTYPFAKHDKADAQPEETGKTIPLIPARVGKGGATWEPECKEGT